MATYDYRKVMYADIRNWINDNVDDFSDWEDLYEKVYEDLWPEDSITGNGLDGYFDSDSAKAAVQSNWDLCREALEEFCAPEEIGDKFLSKNWLYLDTSIRCYLLGEMLAEVLEDLKKEKEDK